MSAASGDTDPLDRPATLDRIAHLLDAGALPSASAREAYDVACPSPLLDEWATVLRRTLLVLGALLLAAGVVFFFAYNWATIPAFGKFALLLAGIALAVVTAHARTLERESGKMALVVAAVLVGPLLAVYGQRYQTGADPYELFLAWALLTLPWALAARSSLLWAVSVALFDVAISLYCDQVQDASTWTDETTKLPLLAGFQFAALFGFEWLLARPGSWLTSPLLHRALAAVGLAPLTLGACGAILDAGSRPDHGLTACACAIPVAWAAIALFYRTRRKDIAILAMGGASVVAVLTTASGKVLFDRHDAGLFSSLFTLGAVLIVEVAVLTTWLRAELRRGGSS